MELAEEQSGWVWRIKDIDIKCSRLVLSWRLFYAKDVLKRLTDPRVFKLPDALLRDWILSNGINQKKHQQANRTYNSQDIMNKKTPEASTGFRGEQCLKPLFIL